jgi:hypothetical protein
LLATMTLFSLFCMGLTRLELAHKPIHWFPSHDPLVQSVDAVNLHLGATEGLEILVDARVEGGARIPIS